MTDKTHAMDRLIAQDADLIDLPTQSDGEILRSDQSGDQPDSHPC
jgi:hypothetical protein